MWFRELSSFCLSPTLLQGQRLRPTLPYFPLALLSSPHHRVCWLGPLSPSCFGVESLWSPVSSGLCHMHAEQKRAPAGFNVGCRCQSSGLLLRC